MEDAALDGGRRAPKGYISFKPEPPIPASQNYTRSSSFLSREDLTKVGGYFLLIAAALVFIFAFVFLFYALFSETFVFTQEGEYEIQGIGMVARPFVLGVFEAFFFALGLIAGILALRRKLFYIQCLGASLMTLGLILGSLEEFITGEDIVVIPMGLTAPGIVLSVLGLVSSHMGSPVPVVHTVHNTDPYGIHWYRMP